jgi:hypothetical protein
MPQAHSAHAGHHMHHPDSDHHSHRHHHPYEDAFRQPLQSRSTHNALNAVARMATLHCLAGCAIGEVAGVMIGTALGWGNGATIALAVVLAFVSGFTLTAMPLLRRGAGVRETLRIALAADLASIAIMELVDNLVMLVIPGAMDAPLDSMLFWFSMGVSLVLAGAAAFPLNRWLISKGKGHALAHGNH